VFMTETEILEVNASAFVSSEHLRRVCVCVASKVVETLAGVQ